MPGPWQPSPWHVSHAVRHHAHPLAVSGQSRGPCLYEIVLREAIATQHGLTTLERHELQACEDCGKPYLLTSVWQPFSDEGAICCPRCGAEVVSWDGARTYVAYWKRDGDARAQRAQVGFSRAPVARSL
jgi:hypothetical protein